MLLMPQSIQFSTCLFQCVFSFQLCRRFINIRQCNTVDPHFLSYPTFVPKVSQKCLDKWICTDIWNPLSFVQRYSNKHTLTLIEHAFTLIQCTLITKCSNRAVTFSVWIIEVWISKDPLYYTLIKHMCTLIECPLITKYSNRTVTFSVRIIEVWISEDSLHYTYFCLFMLCNWLNVAENQI